MKRIASIDMLRGFVIALMALDHVRDFFGFTPFNPEDLAATTPGWFWTRWVTHLCATTFVLLAGCSAWLRGQKTGKPALSRYLFTRGLMLLALEVTWITFSWQLAYHFVILQVIWALGVGMMVLAALIWLPRPVLIAVAALLILPHNLLDTVHFPGFWWRAWHEQSWVQLTPAIGVMVMYPLMPWLGLITAGYALGPVFAWEPAKRLRFLWLAAAALLLAFIALRSGNFYGDPDPWSPQGKGLMADLMSFVRVHKYPPSLLYLCVTGAIGLALLAWFERAPKVGPLMLFGAHPLFFYVIHIPLLHALGNLYFELRYGGTPDFANGAPVLPAGYTPSLAVVYAAWAGALLLMYGLCRAWARRRAAAPPVALTPA
ncbi:MAG: DUF1624 domain-containing protein [Telluria sp.]